MTEGTDSIDRAKGATAADLLTDIAWKKVRKRPVEVRAARLTKRMSIKTLEGTMVGEPGDWLIEGVHGELYPCKHEIFEKTYEVIGDGY